MSEVVLDASAILAILYNEPGAEIVRPVLRSASMNTVNLAEVYTKLADLGAPAVQSMQGLESSLGEVAPFSRHMAELAGRLRPLTRHLGLSLGDRACLAHGILREAIVYTAEHKWAELRLPCMVRLIR